MNHTHTPGPWYVKKFSGGARVIVDRGEQQSVAEIICRWDESEEPANALLIADAPDLLAACEMVPPLLKEIRGFALDVFGGESGLTDCIDLVLAETEAAIAKAKGDSE